MIILAILQILVAVITVPLTAIYLLWKIVYNSIHSVKVVNNYFKAEKAEDYRKTELWPMIYVYSMRTMCIDFANQFAKMWNRIVECKLNERKLNEAEEALNEAKEILANKVVLSEFEREKIEKCVKKATDISNEISGK